MTPEMALVLGIVGVAFLLLMTERLPMDVVALLVLGSLALTNLVDTSQALSGFSSPAVVTVWAVFILSGGLTRTGVANMIGKQVLRLAGGDEIRLTAAIMLTAGVMSAFLNNVGVAALLLPVIMDLSRQTGRSPSRLLMPLAYGALLGGLTTLIGTPPNILVNDVLRDADLETFQLFDFTPVGAAALLAGILFMTLIGRHLLPERDITRQAAGSPQADLGQLFAFQERMCTLRLPEGSPLAGRPLSASRLGAALGLNVLAILRNEEVKLAPGADAVLRAGDQLVVQGRLDRLEDLHGRRNLVLEERKVTVDDLAQGEIAFAEVNLAPDSPLVGLTLVQSEFRSRYGVSILAIEQNGTARVSGLSAQRLHPSHCMLIHATRTQIEFLNESPDFSAIKAISAAEVDARYNLNQHLLMLSIPSNSSLASKSLAESQLGRAFDLSVLGIIRDGEPLLAPYAEELLEADDRLLVKGHPEDLDLLRGLKELEFDRDTPIDLNELESESVGLDGVVLSPQTTLAGKTLRDVHFRDKFGLTVLALWREGDPYRSNLADMPLRFGDALLLYGSRQRLKVLGSEPDFLVLTEKAQEEPRLKKAPLAALIMAGVLAPVILGWLPIAIAAVVGATIMVLTGCLTMEEAYRHIEWRAVFLIAGMLPLGVAMQRTGTADFLAQGVVGLVGELGTVAVITGIFLLTALTSQIMPNAAVTVLMAPIAISTAGGMGISELSMTMVVAISASASFLSPVAHPANSLVMGPGGYRFSDFLKVGLPLTLVILAVVLLLLPIVWPY